MSAPAKAKTTNKQPQRGGFALGMVVGLLLGLAVALGVALYVTKVPVPLMNKGQPQRTPEQDAAEAQKNRNWDPNAALAGKAGNRPAAPAASAEGPAPAPATAVAPATPTATGKPADAGNAPLPATPAANAKSTRDPAAILNGQADAVAGLEPFVYFVQVGAYAKPEDAEGQRAKLAMQGLSAKVTERDQNGRTIYRVRLGPFDHRDEAEAQQDRVKPAAPEASLVRVDRAAKP